MRPSSVVDTALVLICAVWTAGMAIPMYGIGHFVFNYGFTAGTAEAAAILLAIWGMLLFEVALADFMILSLVAKGGVHDA